MAKMSFIPELKKYLLRRTLIYTVRKYDMLEDVVYVAGVGHCRRTPLGKVTCKEDLMEVCSCSGFPTLDAWWSKIRKFIPDESLPMYLYRVDLVSREERH